jgi:hypothetical protein
MYTRFFQPTMCDVMDYVRRLRTYRRFFIWSVIFCGARAYGSSDLVHVNHGQLRQKKRNLNKLLHCTFTQTYSHNGRRDSHYRMTSLQKKISVYKYRHNQMILPSTCIFLLQNHSPRMHPCSVSRQ